MKLFTSLLFSLCLAAPSVAAAEDDKTNEIRNQASQLIKDGKRFQDLGEHENAIKAYTQAYDLIPHPQVLFNLGQVYRMSGDKTKAAEYYQKFIAIETQGPAVERAKEMLALLRSAIDTPQAAPPTSAAPVAAASPAAVVTPQTPPTPIPSPSNTGQIQVSANVPGQVFINGQAVGQTPYENRLRAGVHSIEVRAEGYLTHRAEVTVNAGGGHAVKANLMSAPAPATADAQWYTNKWLWVGVGAALAVTAVVLTQVSADDASPEATSYVP